MAVTPVFEKGDGSGFQGNHFSVLAKWNTSGGSAAQVDDAATKQWGICAAMTCKWIKESIAGGDLTSPSRLGSMHNIAIAHGAQRRGHLDYAADNHGEAVFVPFGLKVGTRKTGTLTSYMNLVWELMGMPGYNYLGTSKQGGHATGWKIDARGHYFFDPNQGLYRFDSQNDLITVMSSWMKASYFKKYLGGTWRIYSCSL